MPRRQQRRPTYRPPRGQRREPTADSAALEAGARRLLAVHDARSLQGLIGDLRMIRDEADKAAFDQPSPQALSAFRRAARELAEAERALSLVEPS